MSLDEQKILKGKNLFTFRVLEGTQGPNYKKFKRIVSRFEGITFLYSIN